jgi:hypothetical protein
MRQRPRAESRSSTNRNSDQIRELIEESEELVRELFEQLSGEYRIPRIVQGHRNRLAHPSEENASDLAL